MSEQDDIVDLADLSADVVRARNDDVDAELAAKESRIDDLESQIEEKAERIATLEDEKEATEELLAEFEQAERTDATERLASVLPDDADLADDYVEQASVDQLHWMADVVEAATNTTTDTATNAPTSNGGADLSQVQGDNVAARKAELAKEMGMADAYEKAQAGQFDKPEGFEAGGDADGGQSANRAKLMEGLEEVLNQ